MPAIVWAVVSAYGCDAGPNAKQCMMNSTRSSGLLRRSTDDPWAMQTQCHLLQCKQNVICCNALQSAAVLTLHQGEQAACIKAEREYVVL